jgi:hypothetical protein
VPPLPPGLTYVEVSAGTVHALARRSDGSVVAWGQSGSLLNVPPLPAGVGYVEIAAGTVHNLARRSDGVVVAWGDNAYGQCNVPALPPGSAFAKIAAGHLKSTARIDHAASALSVGSGCGGPGPNPPTLTAGTPRIGQPVTLSLAFGTPNAAGFLYSSSIPAAPMPVGSGCVVQLDLTTFVAVAPVAANATGAWSLTAGVPNLPSLAGVQLALQAALFGTAAPLGLDITNGLFATLGY